jgi:hypothetical protein
MCNDGTGQGRSRSPYPYKYCPNRGEKGGEEERLKRERQKDFSREKGVKRKGPKEYKRKKKGERIEKRKQGTTGEKYYKKGDVFWGDRGEKGKPTKKRGRTGSDRGRNKKNTREEEQPQLPP